MAEERTQCRLAAIPAGDVFGYTRLVEQAGPDRMLQPHAREAGFFGAQRGRGR